jgi:hypothetical protein
VRWTVHEAPNLLLTSLVSMRLAGNLLLLCCCCSCTSLLPFSGMLSQPPSLSSAAAALACSCSRACSASHPP